MSKDDKNIADQLKVMGHPVRLRILRFLLSGPSCVALTNRNIDISQPNLSQHLKALTEAEILDFCKLGTKKMFFTLFILILSKRCLNYLIRVLRNKGKLNIQ